jgi:hypothetical protein
MRVWTNGLIVRFFNVTIATGQERKARSITRAENTVSTVSSVRHNDHDPWSSQPPPDPVGAARDDSHRPGITAADDADGADAKAALHFSAHSDEVVAECGMSSL